MNESSLSPVQEQALVQLLPFYSQVSGFLSRLLP